eukprot:CAMPEP_0117418890 /NCGR_PEP_ID=MMETSP0758-20121206/576_1 /TAXON_ID=63605 /ORGANISM="Percolomonas cosmopolitus, Strain AE-1 (ATCC 50343)" /LENGTH=987 /DNA_ID=CAMNT_0005199655 /DNA_START=177 /DNA_END=3138 /DNA_ORIENTATION=-
MMLTSIKGTPLYMAPELVDQKPYTRVVDLWSFGVILYELYVGKTPFVTTNLVALMNSIRNHEISFPKDMSPDFADYLKGLLNKDPQKYEHPFVRETEQEKAVREQRMANSVYRQRLLSMFGKALNDEYYASQPELNSKDVTIEDLKEFYLGKSNWAAFIGTHYHLTCVEKHLPFDGRRADDKSIENQIAALKIVDGYLYAISEQLPMLNTLLKLFDKTKVLEIIIQSINDLLKSSLPPAKLTPLIKQALTTLYRIMLCAKNCVINNLEYPERRVFECIPRIFTLVSEIINYKHDLPENQLKLILTKTLKSTFIIINFNTLLNSKIYNDIYTSGIIEPLCQCLSYESILESTIFCLSEFVHPMRGNIVQLPYIIRNKMLPASNVGNHKHDSLRELIGNTIANNPVYLNALIKSFKEANVYAIRLSYQCCRFSSVFYKAFATNQNLVVLLPYLAKVTPEKTSRTFTPELIYLFGALLLDRESKLINDIAQYSEDLIISIFEQFVSTHQNSTDVLDNRLLCCMLFVQAKLASYDSLRPVVGQYFIKSESHLICKKLLKLNFSHFYSKVQPIEGTGYAGFGLMDGLMELLSELVGYIPDATNVMINAGLIDELMKKLLTLDQHSECSLRALTSASKVLIRLSSDEKFQMEDKILHHKQLIKRFLVPCLREATLIQFYKWPPSRLGGITGVSFLVEHITSVLYMAYCSTSEKAAQSQKSILRNETVKHTLAAIGYVNSSAAEKCINFISQLVLDSPTFAAQFMQFADPKVVDMLLRPSNTVPILVDSLLTLSQLARLSAENYKFLNDVHLLSYIAALLQHDDAQVRAKTCNLVGNLCRHNSSFYNGVREFIPILIDRCFDSDETTRKFACFAIGNAGFHSGMLYKDLAPSINPLMQLLKDSDRKTCTNAAGALGNLVRNEGALFHECLEYGVVKELLSMLEKNKHNDENTSMEALEIALFSIGNFCRDKASRTFMRQNDFLNILSSIQSNFL